MVLALLVFAGCGLATPFSPASYDLKGTISAPKCLGGYDIAGASVVIRNERDEVVGSSVAELVSNPDVVAYERALALSDEEAFVVLADVLSSRGVPPVSDARVGAAVKRTAVSYVVNKNRPGVMSAQQARDEVARIGVDPRLWDWAVARVELSEVGERSALQSIFETADLSCSVQFVAQVPRATFYQLKVGSHSAPTYRFEDLAAQGFSVNLSLGR
jgi:hypothetical protein